MSKVEKPYVLIVDDNEATLTLMTAILRRECVVDAATDGQEAIEKLRTKNYGAVVLDLRMPGADGFAVLDFLQAERPEVLPHVMICTAALTKSETTRLDDYDICAFIAKPFEVDTFLAAVKACIEGKGQKAKGKRIAPLLSLLPFDFCL